jgi:hypothetical protein
MTGIIRKTGCEDETMIIKSFHLFTTNISKGYQWIVKNKEIFSIAIVLILPVLEKEFAVNAFNII